MTTSESKQPVLIIIAGPNGSSKTTNSVDFEKAKLIFRASNGSLIKKYSNIPNWILPILNELKTN